MSVCPHCKRPLSEAQIKSLWASYTSGKRLHPSGGHSGGRPRSDAPRCECGQMTAARAAQRKHKCQKEEK